MSEQPIFTLRHAAVVLGRVSALSELNMAIAQGERVALVGANGSGKSTLLRLLHGLIVPTQGIVQRDATVRQAFVFQRPFVMRTSVQRNVALAAWLQGAPWRVAHVQATQALQDAGLQALMHRPARTLSGGQQQLLALARAMVTQPQCLLLDEPTANLSPQAKREVETTMQRAVHNGMSLVFASHNLGQVKRLASRVVCLDAGRIVADCSVEDFFTKPLPEAAARFVQGESL